MANEEHLGILRQGVKVWNQWRREHSGTVPNLNEANLNEALQLHFVGETRP